MSSDQFAPSAIGVVRCTGVGTAEVLFDQGTKSSDCVDIDHRRHWLDGSSFPTSAHRNDSAYEVQEYRSFGLADDVLTEWGVRGSDPNLMLEYYVGIASIQAVNAAGLQQLPPSCGSSGIIRGVSARAVRTVSGFFEDRPARANRRSGGASRSGAGMTRQRHAGRDVERPAT